MEIVDNWRKGFNRLEELEVVEAIGTAAIFVTFGLFNFTDAVASFFLSLLALDEVVAVCWIFFAVQISFCRSGVSNYSHI